MRLSYANHDRNRINRIRLCFLHVVRLFKRDKKAGDDSRIPSVMPFVVCKLKGIFFMLQKLIIIKYPQHIIFRKIFSEAYTHLIKNNDFRYTYCTVSHSYFYLFEMSFFGARWKKRNMRTWIKLSLIKPNNGIIGDIKTMSSNKSVTRMFFVDNLNAFPFWTDAWPKNNLGDNCVSLCRLWWRIRFL